jgi:TRAP-type C4-dicarboxylate transport system permease small subunit
MSIVRFDKTLVDGFEKFNPIVEQERFLTLAVQLLLTGFLCVVAFLSYEVTHSTTKSRSIVKEIVLAVVASVLLGVGILMAMLGVGLFV